MLRILQSIRSYVKHRVEREEICPEFLSLSLVIPPSKLTLVELARGGGGVRIEECVVG